ncbi:MAG: hypothetical protein ACR2OG_09205 [Gemmatimonadaceae bacterium]
MNQHRFNYPMVVACLTSDLSSAVHQEPEAMLSLRKRVFLPGLLDCNYGKATKC